MIRCISLYRSGLPAVIWPGREHLTMLQSVNSEFQGCDVSKLCKGTSFASWQKGSIWCLLCIWHWLSISIFLSYVFQRIKGQFLPEKLWSSQMSHAPSMICRALCTGRLEGCFCQWLKGRKESCLKIHSGRVQYKHASKEWRGNVWREIHIPASGCTGTLYIYIHITKLRFKVVKRKHQRPVPRCMHAKLMGEKLPVWLVNGSVVHRRCWCFDVFVTS